MIEALRGDATIRQNYQIWFFSYPTGYPYPLMAAVLRKKMDAINAYYPDHKTHRRHRSQHGRHDRAGAHHRQRHEDLEYLL